MCRHIQRTAISTSYWNVPSMEANHVKDHSGYGKFFADAGYGQLFPRMWKSLFFYLSAGSGISPSQGFANFAEMLMTYISLSDVSPDLCESLGKHGGIQTLLEGLKHIQAAYHSEAAMQIEVYILQILHNTIRLASSNLSIFRTNNAVVILTEFLQVDNMPQVLALMILAYVVSDAESALLAESRQGVRVLIDMFKSAANSPKHCGSRGTIMFSAFETLDAINHLAINDDIKRIVEEQGAIPSILRMLQHGFNAEEQQVAVEALWNLAFIDGIRQSRQIQDAVPTLQRISRTENSDLQRTCQSALWQIETSSNPGNEDTPPIRSPPPSYQQAISQPDPAHQRQSPCQIMLSYQWDSQQTVLKIKEALVSAGYRVWMDVTHLRGDILEAMAKAVEESDVVLICMTENYKNSQSCRSEASYVYKKCKPSIPLLLEENYRPDGWLGLVQGMDLYYHFESENRFEKSMEELLKAIDEVTGVGNNSVQVDGQPTQQDVQGEGSEGTTNGNAIGKPETRRALEWNRDDVQLWLQDNDLSELCDKFSKFNGKHLRKLYTKCTKDEDKFEDELKSDYKLNALHCTQFIVALEEAFEDA